MVFSELFQRFSDDEPTTKYYCPKDPSRTEISVNPQRIEWREGSEMDIDCDKCEAVHIWNLGIAPAPVYVGDRIVFTITIDEMVQSKLDSD